MTEDEFRTGKGVVHGEPSQRYIADALTTLSPQWHGELVGKSQFNVAISNVIYYLNKLDDIKKSLFYGKENRTPPNPKNNNVTDLPERVGRGGVNGINTIHAIIGIATEAGELLEALRNSYDNPREPLDIVNLKEEVGDLFWYVAILANECGFSFESAQRVNIAKLKARYPDKFNSDKAIERNLDNERKVLETDI